MKLARQALGEAVLGKVAHDEVGEPMLGEAAHDEASEAMLGEVAHGEVEEAMLGKAKDQATVVKEDALATQALASKVVTDVIEAFKAGEEYHLEILEASRDAFQLSFEFLKGSSSSYSRMLMPGS